MLLSFDRETESFYFHLRNDEYDATRNIGLSGFARRNITEIDKELNYYPRMLDYSQKQLITLRDNLETAKGELGNPFPQEKELKKKEKRLAEVSIQIEAENMADKSDKQETTKKAKGKAAEGLPFPVSVNSEIQDKKSLNDRLTLKINQAAVINGNREKTDKSAKNRYEEL